jgi:hypothetical protein
MGVQVPDEGRLVIKRRGRRRPVIPAAGGHPAHGIQPVGQRGAGHRAEPAVADRELLRQVVVDRHVGGVVVTHDTARVPVLAASGQGCGRAGHEAAHVPAGDLLVDRARGVVGVHRHGRRAEVVHRVGAP